MPKKVTQTPKRVNPYSAKNRALIQNEIRTFYGPSKTGVRKTAIKSMQADAEAYNGGHSMRVRLTNQQKGSGLVDAGCFRVYYDDQANFLKKIFGKQVDNWSGDRIHKTYANLIGHEYSKMIAQKPAKRKTDRRK